jgi:hypothetical protein
VASGWARITAGRGVILKMLADRKLDIEGCARPHRLTFESGAFANSRAETAENKNHHELKRASDAVHNHNQSTMGRFV